MTIRYVYSSSLQDDSDSTWNSSTISYTTLQGALTAWASGDLVYVAHDHAETHSTTQTLTCGASSNTDRVPIYRVNRSTGAYAGNPGGAGTPQIDITGTGNDINISFKGVFHGIHVRADDRINFTASYNFSASVDCYWESGAFYSDAVGNASQANQIKNSTVEFNSASGYFYMGAGKSIYEGFAIVGDAHADGTFRPSSATGVFNADFVGCDFTGLTNPASEYLIDVTRSADASVFVNLVGCLTTTSRPWVNVDGIDNPHSIIKVHNCGDDGDTFVSEQYMMAGAVYADTSCYFTGTNAAVDADGSTPVSREMVPTSLCDVHEPMQSIDMLARVETTGSKTFTVEIVENFTSALTQQECWLEVFALDSASTPEMALSYSGREFIESSYTNLAAGAGLASWTGEPASSRSEKVTATVTIGQAGVYVVRLMLGKYESAKEFFYNPVVTVT